MSTRVIQLELDSVRLNNPREFAKFIRLALTPIVVLNVFARKAGRVPALYASGVRYKKEPEWPEKFRDAQNVYKSGYGDCAQLAAWRVADYIVQGKKAKIAVMFDRKRRIFHVVVRRHDGRIEDPSTVLLGGR